MDTSQAYAEVIQEAEWVNNALPLLTRYDIGLDRLRMFKSQVTSNGPPPVYSPVVSGWYLFDGLGSTRAVVDDSGVGQSEFGYGDAFGIPYQVAANGSRSAAGAGFFLNGQQWDGSGVWNSGEGLYFNRARYYQPGLGRFVGEDPLKGQPDQPSTLHRYRYADNNPVNYIDPSGLGDLGGISGRVAVTAIIGTLAVLNVTQRIIHYFGVKNGPGFDNTTDNLIFKGNRLEWWKNGKLYKIDPAFSGTSSNSAADAKDLHGPIPPGKYWIDPTNDQFFSYSPLSWWPSIGGSGFYKDAEAWGTRRTPIKLAPGTKSPGERWAGYFIHGGVWVGSHGCIDLGPRVDEWIDEIGSTLSGKVKLEVDYRNWKTLVPHDGRNGKVSWEDFEAGNYSTSPVIISLPDTFCRPFCLD